MAIHDTAAAGYRRAGDDYERARPAYPGEALDAMVSGLGLGPSSVVVELGAGTGKFSRLMAPRVGLLVATEPVAEMRAHLVAAVTNPVVAATAEAVPVAAGRADAVVAATAFHWFQADVALAEAERVLRPGGGIGLTWNNPDRRVDWVARVWGVVDQARGSVPGNRDMRWQEAFVAAPAFSPLASASFSHEVVLTSDQLEDRVTSISFVAALPDAEREALLTRVRAIIATDADLSAGATVRLPYRTDVYWSTRR